MAGGPVEPLRLWQAKNRGEDAATTIPRSAGECCVLEPMKVLYSQTDVFFSLLLLIAILSKLIFDLN